MNLHYTTTECLGRHYEVEIEYNLTDEAITVLSVSLLNHQNQCVVDLLPALDSRQLTAIRRDILNYRENLKLPKPKFLFEKESV